MNIPLLNETAQNINIKSYILDPLSVIVKLAILGNKPIGTKIIIKNNIISFQDPSIFQFIYRYVTNSSKTDLHFMYNPIHIACQTFLKPDNELNDISCSNQDTNNTKCSNNSNNKKHKSKGDKMDYKKMKKLFNGAQKGLKNLIETYRTSSMITVCLNYYYSIITNYIDNSDTENLFHKDNMTSLYTEEAISQLNNSWSEDRIKIVLDLIQFLQQDDTPEHNVKSLENIIDNIDRETQNTVSTI